MEAQFWLDKWHKQETGFHLASVHPLLQKFYAEVFEPQLGVFVPLCGKTSDLAFFAEKGSYTDNVKVVGCELAENAVKAFFAEQKQSDDRKSDDKQLKVSELESFKSYQLDNIEILVGDYFDLQPKQLEACTRIYDRAALIALPESMRKVYVEHMRNLLPHAKMLLISLEYPQHEMNGPPFSVSQDAVNQLFSFAKIKQVYTNNILSKEPKFESRGLSALYESAYVIEW